MSTMKDSCNIRVIHVASLLESQKTKNKKFTQNEAPFLNIKYPVVLPEYGHLKNPGGGGGGGEGELQAPSPPPRTPMSNLM